MQKAFHPKLKTSASGKGKPLEGLPLFMDRKPRKTIKWWRGPESNRGHEDFQSTALPTELPRHVERAGGFRLLSSVTILSKSNFSFFFSLLQGVVIQTKSTSAKSLLRCEDNTGGADGIRTRDLCLDRAVCSPGYTTAPLIWFKVNPLIQNY